jgi:hypothetical protein
MNTTNQSRLGSSWGIESTGIRNEKLGQIWLAQPIETDCHLILAGHIEHGDAATTIRVEQAGIPLLETIAEPGFCCKIPLRQGIYMLSLWHGGERLRQWEVLSAERRLAAMSAMDESSEMASTATEKRGPYAIQGRMGDLFLAGDSNDSVGQFTENRNLSAAAIAAWDNVFTLLPVWCKKYGLLQSSLLIAPAKEEIRREYYPFPRATRTVLDDFMTRFRDRGVIFPKWELWGRRDLVWSYTDTHWTDYGATVAAGTVLKAWGLPTAGLPDTFTVCQRIGDLGTKTSPNVASHELCFMPEVDARKVFDNGISNQGNIRIYRNSNAPHKNRLLIFGDSFGTNLLQAFSGVFSDVTYAYQPAGFDPALVEIIRPHFVLLQITQRFLHGQPATDGSVFEMAKRKVSEMTPECRRDFVSTLSLSLPHFDNLITPILDGIVTENS